MSSPAPSSTAERNARWALLALALALSFTLATRLWGIGFLLPHRTEPDRELAQQVLVLGSSEEHALESPVMAKYPWLIARLATLGYRTVDPRLDATPRSLEAHAARCSAPTLHVRVIVTALGLLIVPATWWLARRFFGPADALLAAWIVAASLLHHSFSQQARPHVALASFVTLAVLACARLATRGRTIDWVLASLATALAIGTLHSGIATLCPLGAAIALRSWRDRFATIWRLVFPIATTVLAIVWFYPFLLVAAVGGESAGFEIRGSRIVHGDHTFDLHSFHGRGFVLIARSMWFYEPALSLALAAAILIALGALLRRRAIPSEAWDSLFVTLSFVLPYFVVIGLYQRTFQRFLLPLLPFFALLAVYGWSTVRALLVARVRPGIVRAASVLAWGFLVALPAANVMRQAWLHARPDTYEELASWIESTLDPAEDRLACLPPLGLPPLLQSDESLTALGSSRDPAQLVYWHVYQALVPSSAKLGPRSHVELLQFTSEDTRLLRTDPEEFVRKLPFRYVALETEERSAAIAKRRTFEAILREKGEVVARFAPDELPLPLEYQERQFGDWLPSFSWRLWGARAAGPVIEVLRMSE